MSLAWGSRLSGGSLAWGARTASATAGIINGSAVVSEFVESDLVLTWQLHGGVESDLVLLWQVDASPITSVESDLVLTWNIITEVGDYVESDLDLIWQRGSVVRLIESIGNISAGSDTGTYQYDLSEYFTYSTVYSIAPALEAGWSFDPDTGILEIDTDADGTFGPYTVSATNLIGNTESNPFTVKVSDSTRSLYGSFTLDSPFAIRL